uniref:Uncharacterized protein n=1 Tax=uncultured marine group II/III euryarchaeote KM3_83_G03 TaxID=1456522 RepID=A0A075HQL5_9EURY|nr:hypothetical protein [uncultured marine group II/III euryarchaeote KM3_83_G03]
MWLALLFSVINGFMSFIANYVIRLSCLDIAPVAIILIAWRGESIFFGAFMMVLVYNLVSPKDFGFLWIVFPLTLLTGYLALVIHSFFVLLLIYHIIGLMFAYFFAYLNPRYMMFALANFSLNVLLGKAYNFFF